MRPIFFSLALTLCMVSPALAHETCAAWSSPSRAEDLTPPRAIAGVLRIAYIKYIMCAIIHTMRRLRMDDLENGSRGARRLPCPQNIPPWRGPPAGAEGRL